MLQSDMLACVEEAIYFGNHTKLVPMKHARKFSATVGFAVMASFAWAQASAATACLWIRLNVAPVSRPAVARASTHAFVRE
jgi:hypothetical protein